MKCANKIQNYEETKIQRWRGETYKFERDRFLRFFLLFLRGSSGFWCSFRINEKRKTIKWPWVSLLFIVYFSTSRKLVKNKKHLKRRVKKEKRETQEFFFKDTNSLLFFALLSLEKIHLIERRLRTHQEDFTKTLWEERVRRREREMMSSSEDENSATADRVEKKSIDEAIASFAMLVRIEYVYLF